MATLVASLSNKHCAPCEGESSRLPAQEVQKLLQSVPDWKLAPEGVLIRRQWRTTDFSEALQFLEKVGHIAEEEGHHPDLHLVGYRNVTIELSTHSVGGLTENDFILAAKIDEVPVQLQP